MSLQVEDDGKGGVRATNAMIYNAVGGLDRSVQALTGKVDDLVRRDDDADAIHREQDQRIRVVEDWKSEVAALVAEIPSLLTFRWKAAGALVLLAFFFSTFGYFIAQAVVHVHR